MENNHKEFKPFDRVLVRDSDNVWQPDLYCFWDKCRDKHTTIADTFISDDDILPYEGNEHLVGTTDEPEEEIKLEVGEWLMVSDYFEGIKCMYCTSSQFEGIEGNMFIVNSRCGRMDYKYAVRFQDFNPSDMEETKKHILCARNGKVVKYKKTENYAYNFKRIRTDCT